MSFGKDKFEAMKTSTATVRSCNGGGGGLSEIYITWSFASTPPGRLHGVMLGTRVIVCLINELVHQCDAFVTYFDQI